MPALTVTEFLHLGTEDDTTGVVILPADPQKWVESLKTEVENSNHLTVNACNIADGEAMISVCFGPNSEGSLDYTEKAKLSFGFSIHRKEFKKFIRMAQFVLDASEAED